MSDPQHEPFDQLAAFYAMGALTEDEQTAFEPHLEICRGCVREVTSLFPVTHGLLHTSPPLDPPAGLRVRVLGQVTGTAAGPRDTRPRQLAPIDTPFSALDEPETPSLHVNSPRRSPGVLFWLTATLLIAAGGAGGWYAAELDRQNRELRAAVDVATTLAERAEMELGAARAGAADREAVLAIVTGPDVQQVDLDGQPLAPHASARALWNDTADMVFVTAGLPALPAGDIYQLWFMLPDAPVSAALVEPDADGHATVIFRVPGTVTLPATMAITVEPSGGMPAPSGDIYLLGQPTE